MIFNKTRNFLAALSFSIIFYYSYVSFLYPNFPDLKIALFNPSLTLLFVSFLMSSVPILFYNSVKSISSFVTLFIYLILYIPTIITFALAMNEAMERILLIQSVFFFSICLMFLADDLNIRSFGLRIPKFVSFRSILVLTILLDFYTLYVYWGNLNFVSFSDIYVQRLGNIDIGVDTASKYLTTWLRSFFVPLCLLYGIFKKNILYFIVGCFSCVIIYMAIASKGIILMPIFLLGLYLILAHTSFRKIPFIIILLASITVLVLTIFSSLFERGSIIFWAAFVIILRIFATGGFLTVAYYEYFLNNPNTYYTHVRPINALLGSYPYGDMPISRVLGQYYWTEDMNANANFWATDGIAAMGLVGVFLISLVFCLFLIFLNSITKEYNKIFLILLFYPFLSTLLNTSLFQTMWSGGGLFIIILLLFLKTDRDLTNQNNKISL